MEVFRLCGQAEVGESGELSTLLSSVGIAVVEYLSCKLWNQVPSLWLCELYPGKIIASLRDTHSAKKGLRQNVLFACSPNESVLLLVAENWICSFWCLGVFCFPAVQTYKIAPSIFGTKDPSLFLCWHFTPVLMVLACSPLKFKKKHAPDKMF